MLCLKDRRVGLLQPSFPIMRLKDRITHESLKLFSEKGYLNTSISDIMEAADTSKGGFYNHYDSKEALFYEVLVIAQSIWREKVLYGLNEIDSPSAKVKKLLENYRDRYLAGSGDVPGGCIFVRVSLESSDLAYQWPGISQEISEGFDRFKVMIRRYLDQAKSAGEIETSVDTAETADIVFSSMMGASVMYSMDKSKEKLNGNITSIIRFVDSKRNRFRKEAS